MNLMEVKTFHKTPYPAINPKRPELSQQDKTILVTGGNGGIGFAISRNFIAAAAKRVIIIGRGKEKVDLAVSRLAVERQTMGTQTIIDGRVCDIGDQDATRALWDAIARDGIFVDVLVLNAASFGGEMPLLEAGCDRVWQTYNTNVRSHLDFSERLYKQRNPGVPRKMYLINISTAAVHMWRSATPQLPAYGLTKSSSTALMQQIAKDVTPDQLQIVSIHPGSVLSDTARAAGLDESSHTWDDENLAGGTVVWASTPEAEFLHGRFIWTNWDVQELKSGDCAKRIAEDFSYLKVGVEGLSESKILELS